MRNQGDVGKLVLLRMRKNAKYIITTLICENMSRPEYFLSNFFYNWLSFFLTNILKNYFFHKNCSQEYKQTVSQISTTSVKLLIKTDGSTHLQWMEWNIDHDSNDIFKCARYVLGRSSTTLFSTPISTDDLLEPSFRLSMPTS